LIAKSKLEIIVPENQADVVMDSITKNARTGAHGDGIIYVLPVETIVNILSLGKGE
jgi:nitrogen regulatory protein P-II 1